MMKRIVLITAILALCLAARNAPAQAPGTYQVESVRALSGQLIADSDRLLNATVDVVDNYSLSGGVEAIARVRDFNEAARILNHEIRFFAQNPFHTQVNFENLMTAYQRLQPYGEVLWRVPGAQGPLQGIADAMMALTGYYTDVPATVRQPWKVRQNAADIVNGAAGLAAAARGRELLTLASEAAVERLLVLHDAARNFYAVAVTENAPSGVLAERYEYLVFAIKGARDVIGSLPVNYQKQLGNVWRLTEELAYLSPSTQLGDYNIYDFQR